MSAPQTATPSTSDDAPRGGAVGKVIGSARRFGAIGPLISLVVLVVLLSLLSPFFLEVNNLFNVFQQITVLAIIALGATMVIVSGGIDLSVGSVAALSGMVAGVAFGQLGLPMELSLVLSLLVGAAAGLVNGLLIVLGKVPPFVATLAMLSVARGITLVLSNGQPVSGFPDWFREIGTFDLFGVIPGVVILVAVLYAAGSFYLRFRPAGRSIYAVGGSEEVARLSGVNVGLLKIRVYTIAGALAGLGGLVLTSRLNSAQPTAGSGLELDVIAAVVIGGTSLSGGVGTVIGTLIGALIIGVLRNGLNLLDVSSFWQQVVIGAVIAGAVMVDTLGRRARRRRP
ncbi:ABC transporter permease [Homoserinibacter sp. YIM 151385]|uniref:ABC transporter permease n=1 Tax=Homoserinibacter sp. YIM 151385 TaxID=2985506 RepID=UPI0022F04B2A|nr:ABC transporter permease [Homoserinibacter sp. YIM 151385]WBU37480.1 ABC transporter permease [Homoserinibacter sp. YIM 151385]